jgi:hypothetical protein
MHRGRCPSHRCMRGVLETADRIHSKAELSASPPRAVRSLGVAHVALSIALLLLPLAGVCAGFCECV